MKRIVLYVAAVVCLAATATVRSPAQATFNAAGGGGFWGPGLSDNMHGWASGIDEYTTIVTTNYEVRVRQFILQSNFTIGHVTAQVGTAAPSGETFNFGIYSSSGSLLLDSGAFDSSSTSVQTHSITSVSLSAGTYYFAQTASDWVVQTVGVAGNAPYLIVANGLANATTPRYAYAANQSSGGALPSTLGTLTAETTNPTGSGLPFFEP
jgi:hypothetical protein